jgi:hypothetical protein
MTGVPGTGGLPPKRASQRRRKNKPKVPVDTAPGFAKVKVPPAKRDWHPIAKRWYWSLANSGQAAFYEPADWETAWVLAESMSREFQQEGPPRAAAMAAWRTMMAALMVTEGDRRRARLELVRTAQLPEDLDHDDDVSDLDEFRRRLQSS